MFQRPIGFFVIVLCSWGVIYAEIFQECGQRTNVYVASSESCTKYIFCDGEQSTMGECEKDTPYFSETDQTCDTQQSVCKNNEGSNSTETNPETSSTTNPAQSLGTTTTTAPTSNVTSTTLGFSATTPVFTTPNSKTSVSTTPVSSTPDLASTISTTSISTATPFTINNSSVSPATFPSSIPTSTIATNVATKCPATDDPSEIVFLPHPTSCSNYFMCYHGEPMPMHCSAMLHFDTKSQKCDYPENVKCQLDSASPREKCQVHTIDVYPYPENCNYYYLCRFGYLMVMQCPLNMVWDYEKKACWLRRGAKCYHPSEGNKITIM